MCSKLATKEITQQLLIRQLGRQPYQPVWQAMQDFTDKRDEHTRDELWVLEHEPVFTQGQAGKAEHILAPGDIPVVQVDRGGQVTYHGPGQLVVYFLLDIRRRKVGVRQLVNTIEDTIVALMANYGVVAAAKADAPGVYVQGDKLCSLGLRIRKGCSFHGLALNVDMDLSPFARINPCGYAGMQMVQTKSLNGPQDVTDAATQVTQIFAELMGYQEITETTGFA
ncbi:MULTISPECIES: lipoyl(octanoyl) transferase LipB [Pseudidiomarina]|uniref:Octanoyltransferase n=3 Tax=Pseudidiomarina TaxID=2800384 RepID=A0A368VAA0_9GAMM|nr:MULTISPECIES: lipoyl(octanoyl) transferase LipB [Pseudidiomarina]MDX1524746.1 lipoyl(octanoyl) transferase LipB [Pseudidiomarina maritima]PWW16039.1 lipoyl(octanoyl) transferase [Pseudidiomarina maritima]RBP93451.1 lipoyl(octanoyl) transferase [Pseudidiomarina tainanensis]RCW35911.1 lipoyl(octanoyl) transferase [Pseudidiomarina tainanensis]